MKGPEAKAVHEARRARREHIATGGSECGVEGHERGDMDEAWYCTKCYDLVPRFPGRRSVGIQGVTATASAEGKAI